MKSIKGLLLRQFQRDIVITDIFEDFSIVTEAYLYLRGYSLMYNFIENISLVNDKIYEK